MQINDYVLGSVARRGSSTWERGRLLAEKLFTAERLEGGTLALLNLMGLGLVFLSMHKAFHNAMITGLGITVFGYF